MKLLKYKNRFAILILLAALVANFANLYAQSDKQQKPNNFMAAIQTKKIAFFTSELKLTPQEAEKFWPLYNELWEERIKARKETMAALKTLREALDATPEKGDSEIKKLSEIYLANYAMEAELINEYFGKFQKILPVKKAARILPAEEKFRRMLIKQLRHSHQSTQEKK